MSRFVFGWTAGVAVATAMIASLALPGSAAAATPPTVRLALPAALSQANCHHGNDDGGDDSYVHTYHYYDRYRHHYLRDDYLIFEGYDFDYRDYQDY